jgi:Fe-Mn family superoxide dismutase
MSIELPDLACAYDALAPVISEATMRTHHGKHHRSYVNKPNALVRDTRLAGNPLEAVVRRADRRRAVDPVMVAVFNNAAQAWIHAFYWRSLRPKGGPGPQGALAARGVLRKLASRDGGLRPGDTSSLLDPAVVDDLVGGRPNLATTVE